MKKASNEFEPFLNECQTYVWEWYIPEHKVRFGIPSLNRLWIDDKEKNIKLSTMLERVHPDDIQKVLVRKTSPLFRSDKMFEVDLRLNVADELMPDGAQASGKYEWYGFRGKTIRRDAKGSPTYVRGVAINLDQRYRAQMKLIAQKEHQLQSIRQQNDYFQGVMQEVHAFMRGLAENANSLVTIDPNNQDHVAKLNDLQFQAERILSLTDNYRSYMGEKGMEDELDIKPLLLWEHLAELQQIYSLKSGSLKIIFSNPYDNCVINVNEKVLDLLIDNIINIEHRNSIGGTVTISYQPREATNLLFLTILCSNTLAEGGLGLGVSRILAKRLWGEVSMHNLSDGKVKYIVTIPFNALNTIQATSFESDQDTLEEIDQESGGDASPGINPSLPMVLLGLTEEVELFSDQHLFEPSVHKTTDGLLAAFQARNPEMVFVDNRLPGSVALEEVIRTIHSQHPETPIIVTANEAQRALHKHLRQLGAQYLLTNPVTIRKVNIMVKRYLK